MKKLKIAGIVLVLFILYVIIGMLVPFVHMKSVSKTNKSKIHTETFYSTSNENGSFIGCLMREKEKEIKNLERRGGGEKNKKK